MHKNIGIIGMCTVFDVQQSFLSDLSDCQADA